MLLLGHTHLSNLPIILHIRQYYLFATELDILFKISYMYYEFKNLVADTACDFVAKFITRQSYNKQVTFAVNKLEFTLPLFANKVGWHFFGHHEPLTSCNMLLRLPLPYDPYYINFNNVI